VNITWTMNDEDFLNVNINKDGMIEEGNNEYTLDQYLTKHEESIVGLLRLMWCSCDR